MRVHVPALAQDEVHVWRIPLDVEAPPGGVLWQTLATGERARAAAFLVDAARRRYVVARGALRSILAGYLASDPGAVPIATGPFGKPGLVPGASTQDLRFNLSHSGELALCAVAVGREVGIDVERMHGGRDLTAIAERFFSPPEAAALRATDEGRRARAFFKYWTRKEAFVKARGLGLLMPLDQFSVSLEPDLGDVALAATNGQAVLAWSLHALEADPGYVAALGVEGRPLRIVNCSWGGPGAC